VLKIPVTTFWETLTVFHMLGIGKSSKTKNLYAKTVTLLFYPCLVIEISLLQKWIKLLFVAHNGFPGRDPDIRMLSWQLGVVILLRNKV